MAIGGMDEGQQWHGSLRKKAEPVQHSGQDKYNRPADRLKAKPTTAAALKPDAFRKRGYGAP